MTIFEILIFKGDVPNGSILKSAILVVHGNTIHFQIHENVGSYVDTLFMPIVVSVTARHCDGYIICISLLTIQFILLIYSGNDI